LQNFAFKFSKDYSKNLFLF
jgi:hypothetical protein